MPDYKNGKIYKLWSPEGNEIYIGSTTNSLAKRLGYHKKTNNTTCGKYLFENYTDVRIELIEQYSCNNKMELNKREGEHIRANYCLNKKIAGRTKQKYYEDNIEKIKEWREANKEKIAEKAKEYREKNKEKLAEYREANKDKIAEKRKEWSQANKEKLNERDSQKIVCECGCEVRRDSIAKHRRTNKHKEIMQMQSQHQD